MSEEQKRVNEAFAAGVLRSVAREIRQETSAWPEWRRDYDERASIARSGGAASQSAS